MPPLNDDEKHRLFEILKLQSEQLARLEQGMFGDDKLKQKGLIADMVEVKEWITNSKQKIATITGVCLTVGFLLKMLWEWVVNRGKN